MLPLTACRVANNITLRERLVIEAKHRNAFYPSESLKKKKGNGHYRPLRQSPLSLRSRHECTWVCAAGKYLMCLCPTLLFPQEWNRTLTM